MLELSRIGRFEYFKVVPASNQILIKTLRDVNQDMIFDKNDETIWYTAELINEEWVLHEIIDTSGRKSVEKLYFDQWLSKANQ